MIIRKKFLKIQYHQILYSHSPYQEKHQIQISSQGISLSSLKSKNSKKNMLNYYFSYFLLVLKITCILNWLLLYFITPYKILFYYFLLFSFYFHIKEQRNLSSINLQSNWNYKEVRLWVSYPMKQAQQIILIA